VVILSLDTTTRAGSCAVWYGDGLVDEQVGNPDLPHAHRLPNDLAALLASHRLSLQDVNLYAIASGPGSFTGLRVGISTMQALALVHDRLVVPIPSLEALAYCAARDEAEHAQPGSFIGAWMEAYRGEVFGALYRVRSAPTPHSLAELEAVADPDVGTPEAMAEAWRAQTAGVASPSLIVMGDAALAHGAILTARFANARLRDAVPIAGMLARLAARDPARGIVPHAVVPLYLRRPLAELARERLQQQRA
jgi:tRNA threonylcarbamoyladenosine biosynthesis protein TsaB